MHDWLSEAADVLAEATGTPRAELELTGADADTLLDAAALAAHTSGARVNAPLLCFLLGRAAGSEHEVADLAARVRARLAPDS
jgi:hypothetical protein